MRPRLLLSALLCFTLFLLPSLAHSGVPSPSNSSVPQCLLGCPAGDLVITIVVRDIASNPVVNSTVVLDFSACPAFTICTPGPSDPYLYDAATRTVRGVTDATGTVRFPLRAGGVCGTANGVSVFADGVYLAGRTFASPDQDGDLFVNAVDQGIASAKLGAADPTADFDCDGTVTAADLGVVDAHLSHGCSGPTPTRARSWGSVKIIYR